MANEPKAPWREGSSPAEIGPAPKVMEWADRIGGFEAKLLAEEIRSITRSEREYVLSESSVHTLARLQRLPISPRPLCVVFEERQGWSRQPCRVFLKREQAYTTEHKYLGSPYFVLLVIHRNARFHLRINNELSMDL